MASNSNRRYGSSGSSENRRKVHVGTGSPSRKLSEQPVPQPKVDSTNRSHGATVRPPTVRVRPRSFEAEAPRSGSGAHVARGKREDRERRIAEARKKRQVRMVLAIVLVGALAATTIALYRSQLFDIRTVQVVGVEHLTADAIRARAAVPSDATLLRFPARNIERRLLSYAWVSDVQVTRDFPHTLRVRIVERKPAALVDTGKAFWIVDYQGMVLGEQSLEETTTLPIVRDIPGLQLRAGRSSSSQILKNALEVLSGISAQLRQKVRAVSAPSIDETTLLTTDNVEVIVGHAVDLAKKDVIILKIMREQSGSVVTIDVRSTDRPVWRGLGE